LSFSNSCILYTVDSEHAVVVMNVCHDTLSATDPR